MTGCPPSGTAWSSCTQPTTTSSGAPCWRKPTPSECLTAQAPAGVQAPVPGPFHAAFVGPRPDSGFTGRHGGACWPENERLEQLPAGLETRGQNSFLSCPRSDHSPLLSLHQETGFWKSWEGKQREMQGVLRTPFWFSRLPSKHCHGSSIGAVPPG